MQPRLQYVASFRPTLGAFPMLSSRRELLTAAGAVVAGNAMLTEVVGAEQNPAAQVEDRASTIKIAKMRAIWVGPHVYVRIETNHGVVGWGDVKGVDPRVAKPL